MFQCDPYRNNNQVLLATAGCIAAGAIVYCTRCHLRNQVPFSYGPVGTECSARRAAVDVDDAPSSATSARLAGQESGGASGDQGFELPRPPAMNAHDIVSLQGGSKLTTVMRPQRSKSIGVTSMNSIGNIVDAMHRKKKTKKVRSEAVTTFNRPEAMDSDSDETDDEEE